MRSRGMRGGDAAAANVLEGVIVVTVMLSSVAFVVTYDIPAVETAGSRVPLTQKADDILAILNDTPVTGSDLGTNVLSVGIMECLQGDCSRLQTRLNTLMPDGSYYAVYLSNGEGLYPVYVPREPSGEAITARRPLEPAWSYQFLETSQSVYNPAEDPVVVYGLPVFSSNPIYQGGSSLSILVHGNRTSDESGYVMRSAATTRVGASTDTPATPAVSVFFQQSGNALASRDVRSTTLSLGLLPTYANVSFTVRVQESGSGEVPNGTLLTIHVPHGWEGGASQEVNGADWRVISNVSDRNATAGHAITARLQRAVTSGSVDFTFNASYHGDADDYYTFVASLSAGAYAQGSLLVRADAHATTPSFEVPSIVASVPRPMGSSATTTWTLAGFSSEPIAVSRIEIVEEEGNHIFDGVSALSGPGAWASEGDKLVWTGAAALSHDVPLNLTFSVTATGNATSSRETAPFVPSVDLGGWSGRLMGEVSPGLYRGVFLPGDASYKGYNTSTGTALRAAHPAESVAVYRTTALPGNANYTVGYVTGIKDSLFGSDVRAQDRFVPHEGSAELSVDVQSVVYKLGALGFTPSIDVNVYPPWSGDDRTPIWSETVFNGTLAKGGGDFLDLLDLDGDLVPDATNVGRHNISLDIPSGWLYGPYVVEVQVSWLETLSETIGGTPLTEDVMRSARVYEYFVVEPAVGAAPASPVYDVHLVAWYGDWG